MVLDIGSHEATWNGVEIHLGFEPQFIDGQVFVHGLDLQKNLEPLLCGPPLAFGTNRVIVIDPGHGGANAGTHKRSGRPVGKGIHARLGAAAQAAAGNGKAGGFSHAHQRRGRLAVQPRRVCRGASRGFVHQPAFQFRRAGQKQAGLETYCLTPTGMPSTLTRGYADFWSENFPNNAFDAENLQLAVRLQAALLHASGEEDRGVRRARFMGVLHGQHRPAVLIEGGYLSNPREAGLIENAGVPPETRGSGRGALLK